jgi:hypothetical protein
MVDTFKSISELFAHADQQSQSTTLLGMVKPGEGDVDHFMFSPTNCESWLKIPNDGVDTVEYRGQAACRKHGEEPHSHPLVSLRLTKKCVAELPHLAVLSEVVQRQKSPQFMQAKRFASRRGSAAAALYRGANTNMLLRAMPCFLVDDNGSIVVCCCDDNGDNCECGGIA